MHCTRQTKNNVKNDKRLQTFITFSYAVVWSGSSGTRSRSLDSGSGNGKAVVVVLAAPVDVLWNVKLQRPMTSQVLQLWVHSLCVLTLFKA